MIFMQKLGNPAQAQKQSFQTASALITEMARLYRPQVRNVGNDEIDERGIDVNALTNFIGYGRIDAPVVFVGIEEGIEDYDQRLASLFVRSTFDPVMDVQFAHAAGLAHNPRLFNAANVVCQRTWRPMCDLMLRRFNPGFNPDVFARNEYQATQLGRHDGDSLLAELLPYPHQSTRDWCYADLHPECFTRQQYEELILPHRINLLSQQLALYPRDLIVCYGKSHRNSYKNLIQQFRAHLNPRNPAVERDWTVYPDLGFAEVTKIGQTRIVLVNHFTRPPLSTNWALAPFATLCFAPPR